MVLLVVGVGLSTVHNSTPSHARFWVGGSKVEIHRNREASPAVAGGKRGKIQGFSFASRRRFMRRLAEVERSSLPVFVTLTFPDEFAPEAIRPAEWKKVFKRFAERFRRRFPQGGYFWRLEWEKRKSGAHVGMIFPHFHLLAYGVNYPDLLAWVGLAWWEAAGRLSEAHKKAGTRVERVRTVGGTFKYVSKYMAKVQTSGLDVGRVWGLMGIENIPFVKAVLCELTEREAVQFLRYVRRFAHIRGRDYSSLTVLLDAEQWWLRLDVLLYPP